MSSPVAVIAGGGVLPFAVADSLVKRGRAPVVFALKGICDPEQAARFRHHWIAVGQIGRLMALLRVEKCRDVIFIGAMVRPALTEIRLDWGTLREMKTVLASFRGGDDHLLSGIGGILERAGFRMVGLREAAPDLLMPPGNLTRRTPDPAATADIATGQRVLQALSPFDIGQAVVVIDNHVVGVEGVEGTDGLLTRIAQLRSEGRIRARTGCGVLVKAPKTGQDLRYDLPTLGPRTVDGVAKAGLAGIATIAGHTLLAEPQKLVCAAEDAGLFVVGLPA